MQKFQGLYCTSLFSLPPELLQQGSEDDCQIEILLSRENYG